MHGMRNEWSLDSLAARRLWLNCPLEARQHFQGLTFPEKIKWDVDSFGTHVPLFLKTLKA